MISHLAPLGDADVIFRSVDPVHEHTGRRIHTLPLQEVDCADSVTVLCLFTIAIILAENAEIFTL